MAEVRSNSPNLIRMVQIADDIRNLGKITLSLLIITIVMWLVGSLRDFSYLFLAVAALFFLKLTFNVLAYTRLKKLNSEGIVNSEELLEPLEARLNEWNEDDSVKEIDFGGVLGVISFIFNENAVQSEPNCADDIFNSINNDKGGFSSKFLKFREENSDAYPEYANFISTIKISYIEVFSNKELCETYVYFKKPEGHIWYTEFDGERFSELVWY